MSGERPTHRVTATGELVYADGNPAEALEPVSDAEWATFAREQTWTGVRCKRDALLAASDATQCADRPMALQLAWRPYRQALRDLPQSGEDPDGLVWPTPPSGGGA